MSQGGNELVRGTVEQTNEKGVRIDGRWFNYSQFSTVTTRPEAGDTVELEVAKGRFINNVTLLGGEGDREFLSDDGSDPFDGFDEPAGPPASRSRASQVPPPAPAATRGTTQRSGGSTYAAPDNRNAEIRRLALIKAAADFAATRTDLDPEDVQAIAAQWEGWIIGKE